jgi:hypothetical protein
MSVAPQQRRLFNDDCSRENRLNSAGARPEKWGCSSVVTLFFAMKPLTKTDRCAGALLWRRNQLLIAHFSGCFFLTASIWWRRISMYISIYTVYQRIPRTFGSYCLYVWLLWMNVFHTDNRPLVLFMFRVSCTYSQQHYWIRCCWKRQQHSTTKAGVGTSFLPLHVKLSPSQTCLLM